MYQDCGRLASAVSTSASSERRGKEGWRENGSNSWHLSAAYRIINYPLVTRIVVYINGDAAKGGDFGGKFIEAIVILTVVLIQL